MYVLATVARSHVQYIDIKGLIHSLDPLVHRVGWKSPNLPSGTDDEHTMDACIAFYSPHTCMLSCTAGPLLCAVKQRELRGSLRLTQLQLRFRE